MALFAVPGWSMPSDVKPVAESNSRKRKRGVGEEASSSKLQTAEVNMEKLMEKLAGAGAAPERKEKRSETRTDKKLGLRKKKQKATDAMHEEKYQDKRSTIEHRRGKSKKKTKEDLNGPLAQLNARASAALPSTLENHEASKVNGAKRKQDAHKFDDSAKKPTKSISHGGTGAHLTSLQSKMKQGLDGARFRWINETLYKSRSQEAEHLMHEDPKVFEDYHIGFRKQVTSWPINPVDHFIATISSYPERSVIVDLGCGEAVLAQKLVPKGYIVLSFDLISANAFIVAADICGKLPIPGSEADDEGQVVDVVVCCLSLMSTNWLNCIREACRILKKGGELKIAEVASRFTNVEKFTSVICSIGFRLVSRDERNSHFTLFDFKKAEGSRNLDDKVWQHILTSGDVLQPCEYKRR